MAYLFGTQLSGAQLSGAQLYALASGRMVLFPAPQLGQHVNVQEPLPISVLGTIPYEGPSQYSAPMYSIVSPMGMVYSGRLNPHNPPTHVRPAPYDTCHVEQVIFPTSVQVTVDPRFPKWVHVECPNGTMKGWIGQKHVC